MQSPCQNVRGLKVCEYFICLFYETQALQEKVSYGGFPELCWTTVQADIINYEDILCWSLLW